MTRDGNGGNGGNGKSDSVRFSQTEWLRILAAAVIFTGALVGAFEIRIHSVSERLARVETTQTEIKEDIGEIKRAIWGRVFPGSEGPHQ